MENAPAVGTDGAFPVHSITQCTKGLLEEGLVSKKKLSTSTRVRLPFQVQANYNSFKKRVY